MKKIYLLAAILLIAFSIRLYRLDVPDTYYFDEVYHAVTAKAYAKNDPAGYEWWHKAPEPGTAYEWLHPPIAKLFMAGGIVLFGESAWSWRFPGVLFGVGVCWLTYLLGATLTKDKNVGLIAAWFCALDGLLIAQSRIGMNDIYVTFFMVAAVIAYVKARQQVYLSRLWRQWLWLSGILMGLSISTKWSGVFVGLMIGLWELQHLIVLGKKWWRGLPRLLVTFIVLPLTIYILSYSQFWLQGHTLGQFKELHDQIWWYQTHLEATHPFQSKAWEWPLMIRPVWYFVDYLEGGQQSLIYDLANPLLLWFGLLAQMGLVVSLVLMGWKKKKILFKKQTILPALVLPVAYFACWAPWLFSPRIMFFYHYTPAIPFLSLGLAVFIRRWWNEGTVGKSLAGLTVLSITVMALFLLPIIIGIPLTKEAIKLRFFLPTWR